MVDPKLHRKYVTYYSKGNTMLYVQMNKALYGLLQSAIVLQETQEGFERLQFQD